MTPRFTLGRLVGIPIRTGWSTLLIAGFVAWTLAVGITPWSVPHASRIAAWTVGVLVAALIGWFLHASVTQRERATRMADSLEGIRVRESVRTIPATVTWSEPVASVLQRAAPSAGRFVLVTGPEGWVIGLMDLTRLGQLPPERLVGLTVGDVAGRAGQLDGERWATEEAAGALPSLDRGHSGDSNGDSEDGRTNERDDRRLVGAP